MNGEPKRPVAAPSGHPPPARAVLPDGTNLDLASYAREICRRYRTEFPDEEGRYGANGVAWCIHDNQHLLNWAASSLDGSTDFGREVSWLARVLEARDFPLERLERNLEIGAEVLEGESSEHMSRVARVLREGAQLVGSSETFLSPE